jgi:hypothetical protein
MLGFSDEFIHVVYQVTHQQSGTQHAPCIPIGNSKQDITIKCYPSMQMGCPDIHIS